MQWCKSAPIFSQRPEKVAKFVASHGLSCQSGLEGSSHKVAKLAELFLVFFVFLEKLGSVTTRSHLFIF